MNINQMSFSEEEEEKKYKSLNSKIFNDEISKNWALDYMYFKNNEKNYWIEIFFDHKLYNGLEVLKIWNEYEIHIADKFEQEKQTSEEISLFKLPNLEIEARLYKNIGISKFMCYGKRFKTKDIVEFYNQTLNDFFYIPIDMSHVFKQTMLLRFTFSPLKSFEKNWNEMTQVKKNVNNFLFENDNWKNYLTPSNNWISIMNHTSDNYQSYFNHYIYDRNVQGVGVIICESYSYWTFSFLKDPQMIQVFVNYFDLKPCEELTITDA